MYIQKYTDLLRDSPDVSETLSEYNKHLFSTTAEGRCGTVKGRVSRTKNNRCASHLRKCSLFARAHAYRKQNIQCQVVCPFFCHSESRIWKGRKEGEREEGGGGGGGGGGEEVGKQGREGGERWRDGGGREEGGGSTSLPGLLAIATTGRKSLEV